MKRYIKSSYYDEYSEKTVETSGNIYGYEIESTMTYNTVMFCHEDEDYLVRRIKKIYDLLLNSEEGEYEEYCNREGIHIVDDEYGDLVENPETGGWIAEIDGDLYDVLVVAKDKIRW